MTIYKKLQKRQMVSGTQGPCVIVWKNVIVSDPHCHGLPPRTLHPHLGPRTPTQGPGLLLKAQDPYSGPSTLPWGPGSSVGALPWCPGTLFGAWEPHSGPRTPFGAQDPYSGRKSLTQSTSPRLRAHDSHSAPKFLTQD